MLPSYECFVSNDKMITQIILICCLYSVYLLSMAVQVKRHGDLLNDEMMRILKVFSCLIVLTLISYVIVLILCFTIDGSDDAILDDSFQVLLQIKSMFLYTFEKSMMLTVLLFLFKLQRVEIEMDNNAESPVQIISNLNRMNRNSKLATISILAIKIVFIVCYTIENIMDIYSYNETRLIICKTILVILNVPCSIIVCSMWIYFYRMGIRFIDYFKQTNESFNVVSARFIMTFIAFVSVL